MSELKLRPPERRRFIRPPKSWRISCTTSVRFATSKELARRPALQKGKELKGGRRVDPQQPRFSFAGVAPAMRGGALEVQTVAGLETVVFVSVEPDFEFTAKDVQKLLALVRVRFSAAAAGLDAEEVRLHGGIAPS